MFQFLKKIRSNENFHIDNYIITKSKSSLETSIYTCVLDNYVIHFECYHGDKLFNNFGESKILYKDTVISKEKHNLSLSNFTDSFKVKYFVQKVSNLSSNDINYIKRYFKDAISYVKKINIKSLDIMLPFYQKKLLEHVRCLKVSAIPSYQYPCGFVNNILLQLDHSAPCKPVPYNPEINRHNDTDWKNFFILGYNGLIFDHISRHEYTDDNLVTNPNMITQYYQVDEMQYYIKDILKKDNIFTVHDCYNGTALTLTNVDHEQVLLYQIIKSEKGNFGSHMDTYDELYNDTSLHLLWNVDFKNKKTHLTVCIYDDDTFISEYSHSMCVVFENDLLNINYYNDFFKDLIDKLIHCYFPSRKLLELLESALDMTDFDGTLTEEEYYLFKMINI